METEKSAILKNLQLAFLGKIMAGIAHDFNNHLAIIKELDGLLADLLNSEHQEQPAPHGRYHKIISRIDERVEQAKEMSSMLGSFAHRMDLPCSSFDAHAVLSEEVFLLQRFVKQKGLTLELLQTDRPLQIYNNPSLLQFVIFCILSSVIDTLTPGGVISLSLHSLKAALKIIITTKGPKNESGAGDPGMIAPEILTNALSLLQAATTTSLPVDGQQRIAITLADLQKMGPV